MNHPGWNLLSPTNPPPPRSNLLDPVAALPQSDSQGRRDNFFTPLPRQTTLFLLFVLAGIWYPHADIKLWAQQSPVEAARTGVWMGKMEIAGRQFRFVIEQQATAIDGSSQPMLRSIDEGNRRFGLQNFVANRQELRFEISATGAAYQGTYDAGTEQWVGLWRQRGNVIPLSFEAVSAVSLPEPDEVWSGELSAGIQKLLLQLRGYRQPDGRIQYYLDSLTQRAGGFKADQTVEPDSSLELNFSSLGASFSGQRAEDSSAIRGQWTQGLGFDLELTRAERVQESLIFNRPQQPKPPFPYEIREVSFPADGGAIQLYGTLTLPQAAQSCPLAILITGSGPQDRDSTIFGHKSFGVIADHLTRQGIAVLRYDERGVGASGGDFSKATTVDFAADVEAAIEFAQMIPEVDSRRIGLVGHSEGGIIAPMVAARNPSVAWIVLLAAPAVTGEETLLSQGQLIVAAEGGSENDQRLQKEFQLLLFDMVKDLDPDGESDQISDSLVESAVARWREMDEAVTGVLSESQFSQTFRRGLQQIQQPWFRFFLSYDPSQALQQVACPVLYLVGEKDLQVDPKLNLPVVRQSLEKAGNSDFTLLEMPGLNHLFQNCATGAVSEYEAIEETFSLQALETITGWILEK